MAFLQVMTGEDEGKKVEFLQDDISIGRADDNSIRVQDPAASAHHCVVTRKGRRYSLRDLGATNQTRLNDVPTSEARLEPGDIIIVGSTSVMFDGDDVEVDEPSADPGSTVRIAVIAKSSNLPTGTGAPPIGTTAAFGAKRDRRMLMIWLISGLCVIALAAFAWVLYIIMHA